ncbi:MAG: hypothetical protein JW760_09305 [Spirochaetales bacterium]|nr:hypothetical protein [Spirochaetales bacterium]
MEKHKGLRFILTGSSARKLKREGVDLLAGRALFKQAFPFMAAEIQDCFHLKTHLTKGAWLQYGNRDGKIFFWRTKSGSEVDFILYGTDLFAALEVKNSDRIRTKDLTSLKAFKADYPEAKPLLLYRGEKERIIDGIRCLPVESFLVHLDPERSLAE